MARILYTDTMTTILDRIVATKRSELAKAREPLTQLERRARDGPPTRGFTRALHGHDEVRIIAEIKKASPSAGVIRADFDPVAIAQTYARHGAACLSVLTDREYFQGDLEYLRQVHDAVHLPILRKDFVIDRRQLLEARSAGADAVLLIAEILPGDQLCELYEQARELGLDVLVEMHDAEQLPRVLALEPELIGINNRDLRTFATRLEHTLDLLPAIPPGPRVVSESGIRGPEDLHRLREAGVAAVLVGESLMRAADIGQALDRLRGVIDR